MGVYEEVDRLLDGVRRLRGVEKGEGPWRYIGWGPAAGPG